MTLTKKQKEWVKETRDEIMEMVDEFVPATDATRIKQNLDSLIRVLSQAAEQGGRSGEQSSRRKA